MGHRTGADKVMGCDKICLGARRQGIFPVGGIRGGQWLGKCMPEKRGKRC